MEIKRERYLDRLISRKNNGLINRNCATGCMENLKIEEWVGNAKNIY